MNTGYPSSRNHDTQGSGTGRAKSEEHMVPKPTKHIISKLDEHMITKSDECSVHK
jgi:hypothetical protein